MRGISKKHVVLIAVFASSVVVLLVSQIALFSNRQTSIFDTIPRTQFEAWEKIQEHRKRVARTACARFSTDTADETRYVFEALRMDESHGLLYCPVPKVASSIWKIVFLMLTGKVDPTTEPQVEKYSSSLASTLPELKHLELSDAKDRFKHYIKFMFSRHPFERVLSAYRNKMKRHSPDKEFFHKTYGTEIIRRYRTNPSAESLLNGDDVTFEEFVKYIIDTYHANGTNALNSHWRPVTDICRPCSIPYDVIGNFETIDLDADYILTKGKANLDFPKSEKSKRTHDLFEKYYENVSKDDMNRLYHVYEKDFAIFGYERNPNY